MGVTTGVNRGQANSPSSLIFQGHLGAGHSAYLGLVASSATGGRESKREGRCRERREGGQVDTQRETEGDPGRHEEECRHKPKERTERGEDRHTENVGRGTGPDRGQEEDTQTQGKPTQSRWEGGRETENRVRMRTTDSLSPSTAPGEGVGKPLLQDPQALPVLRPESKRFPTHQPQAIPGPESGAQASWGPQNVTPPSVWQKVRGHF